MANTVYDNFYLSNEIEDQYKSHLDLQTFCTVDNALEGTAGMLRKINVYKATDGTEKLAMGAGNSKSIEVGFTPREYRIQLAQNRFKYYDEQAMTDPQLVPVGTKHILTNAVRDYTVYMTVDHQTENTAGGSGDASFASHKHAYKGKKAFKVHLGLKAGEQVLLLRTDGGQKFIIIDRVEAPT